MNLNRGWASERTNALRVWNFGVANKIPDQQDVEPTLAGNQV